MRRKKIRDEDKIQSSGSHYLKTCQDDHNSQENLKNKHSIKALALNGNDDDDDDDTIKNTKIRG